MMFDRDGDRAKPGEVGICPECGGILQPRCGRIKIWHWAHAQASECHHEPETDWHLQWKQTVLDHGGKVEQRIGHHITDAVVGRYAVEFQHSRISFEEIRDRCETYKAHGFKTIWIFDMLSKKSHVDISDSDVWILKWAPSSLMALFEDHKPKYGKVIYQMGSGGYIVTWTPDIKHFIGQVFDYTSREILENFIDPHFVLKPRQR